MSHGGRRRGAPFRARLSLLGVAIAAVLGGCASQSVSREEVALAEARLRAPYQEERTVMCDTLAIEVSANFHGDVSQPGVQTGVHDFTRSSDNGDDVYQWTSRGGLESPLRFHIGNVEFVALLTATLRIRGSGKELALNTVAAGKVTEATTGAALRNWREIHIEDGVYRPK